MLVVRPARDAVPAEGDLEDGALRDGEPARGRARELHGQLVGELVVPDPRRREDVRRAYVVPRLGELPRSDRGDRGAGTVARHVDRAVAPGLALELRQRGPDPAAQAVEAMPVTAVHFAPTATRHVASHPCSLVDSSALQRLDGTSENQHDALVLNHSFAARSIKLRGIAECGILCFGGVLRSQQPDKSRDHLEIRPLAR
mmetsp:Transcript_34782/g.105074  ORF Transcript_34782/g.105074 Transcript_34782/m.105074 type:complete len:200 (+) Transcript_34782:1367-1966(+)